MAIESAGMPAHVAQARECLNKGQYLAAQGLITRQQVTTQEALIVYDGTQGDDLSHVYRDSIIFVGLPDSHGNPSQGEALSARGIVCYNPGDERAAGERAAARRDRPGAANWPASRCAKAARPWLSG